MNNQIREWESINKIELLEEKYFKKSGIKPNNISHWNSSDEYKEQLSQIYSVDETNLVKKEIFDYKFSYDTTPIQMKKIIKKLGYKSDDIRCLLTPTGTISITCALNWLKEKCGINQIGIVCPVYFSVLHYCKNIGMTAKKLYIKRDSFGELTLPQKQIDGLIKNNSLQALYITNPIYCTSSYITNQDIKYINDLLDAGVKIIWDACLSINHTEIVDNFSKKNGFIAIHEPHKVLSVNGRKFSAICFKKEELDFFERWADIIYGGLSESNNIAIEHYLSNNYNACMNLLIEEIQKKYLKIKELSEKYENVKIDSFNKSIYITCYFKNIDASMANKNDFLSKIIKETQGSFIPGNRNHFNNNLKFCFRINLTRCDDVNIKMIDKMFNILNEFS